MKNLFRIPLLLLGLSAFFFSCEDEPDLGPPPVVDFEVSAKVAEIGELLAFTNNSTVESGTPTFEWNFGDGDLSEKESPTHFYSDTGTYVVTLKVTSEMGASEMVEQNVRVGRRYLKSLELLSWADSNIVDIVDDTIVWGPWDEDGSGPDISWVVFGPEGIGDIDTRANPVADVTTGPVVIDITGDYLLANSLYTVAIVDVDDVNNADSIDIIVVRNQSLNPLNPNLTLHENSAGQFITGKNPDTGEGAVLIGNDPNQLDLGIGFMNFEIR
ncbi:PKD domain-containing protein [Flexithrix dorotheae]|uniref:PKD domain-containing protein n=1 Tax=Flexithrix dorotheae TaxID=70993 RepID=UPI0003621B8F|nr:PKD domain-containing protein [Flexithrix dorotheae]